MMGRKSSRVTGVATGVGAGTVAPDDHPHVSTSAGDLRGHARPVRTCIGCRERADPFDLVRLVARGDGTTPVVVPDPGRRAAGRGAHLHPTTRCLRLATRRRAFGRALRVQGPLDLTAVRRWVEAHDQHHEPGSAQQE